MRTTVPKMRRQKAHPALLMAAPFLASALIGAAVFLVLYHRPVPAETYGAADVPGKLFLETSNRDTEPSALKISAYDEGRFRPLLNAEERPVVSPDGRQLSISKI